MNVLLVEDETRVADFIRRGLKAEGWLVEHAGDGLTALQFLRERQFDVVVLDLMLPGVSGQDVCLQMRARKDHTPILMLTALGTMGDRVAGLNIGADDYLPKPFDFEELLARINALRRRTYKFAGSADPDSLIHDGICFDRNSLLLTIDGREVGLSEKERDLVALFLSNPKRMLSRERILNAVWGTQEDPMTNVVDVYVGRVRKKLGRYGPLIATVRGAGYRFG